MSSLILPTMADEVFEECYREKVLMPLFGYLGVDEGEGRSIAGFWTYEIPSGGGESDDQAD